MEFSPLGELNSLGELNILGEYPPFDNGISSSRISSRPGEGGNDELDCDRSEWVTIDDDEEGSSSLRNRPGESSANDVGLRGGEPNPTHSASVPLLAVSPLCSS